MRMSKVISHVTIKLEMDELNANPEDSAPNSGGAMMIGKKRNRTAVKSENTQMKRQKELKVVKRRDAGAPMPPKYLQENLDNAVNSQGSESDDESDDEFDPWAEIFVNTYELSRGSGRESILPRSSIERDYMTWAERYLSSV